MQVPTGDEPLSVAERVLRPTTEAQEYHRLVSESDVEQHGVAIDAAVRVAVQKYVAVHEAFVAWLTPTPARPGGGDPKYCRRSAMWREAMAEYNGAYEAVAALFAVLYPDRSTSSGGRTLTATQALVERRVGRLCTAVVPLGGDAATTHRPDVDCPAHGRAGHR